MSTTPKGTMATRTTPTTRTDTQLTIEAFRDDARARAIRAYNRGDRVDEIAADQDASLETIAGHLRRAGVLEPFDDPRALAHLYHEDDYSLADLAAAFDDAVCPETVRRRMDHYGIDRGTRPLAERLADPDVGPEAIGLDRDPRGRSA